MINKINAVQEVVQFVNIILFLASLMTGTWWLAITTGIFLILWFYVKWASRY